MAVEVAKVVAVAVGMALAMVAKAGSWRHRHPRHPLDRRSPHNPTPSCTQSTLRHPRRRRTRHLTTSCSSRSTWVLAGETAPVGRRVVVAALADRSNRTSGRVHVLDPSALRHPCTPACWRWLRSVRQGH